MPYKDLEKRREYFRKYMAARRSRERSELNPSHAPLTSGHMDDAEILSSAESAPDPPKYNPRRPHRHTSVKVDGRWRRAVEQDGLTFCRDTGELLLVANSYGP